MSWAKLTLLLHTVVETAAAASFLVRPQSQLPGASDDTKLLLQSYGGLLLSSTFLCILFIARRESDDATCLVALGTASYHLWPVNRALTRIRRQGIRASGEKVTAFGGPAVHLAVHVFCFVALLSAGLRRT